MQLHISRLDFDIDSVAKNIARLTKLRVPVHITELDVALPIDANGKAQKQDSLRPAAIWAAVVRACVQNSGCTAIQTWGFTDKYSGIGSHCHGARGAALPFDRAYKPKPAYQSMLKELTSGRNTTS